MTVLLSSQTIKSTVQVTGRLQKVTVRQQVNTFPAFYGDPSIHLLVHNSMNWCLRHQFHSNPGSSQLT
jgi:hypothetical protein